MKNGRVLLKFKGFKPIKDRMRYRYEVTIRMLKDVIPESLRFSIPWAVVQGGSYSWPDWVRQRRGVRGQRHAFSVQGLMLGACIRDLQQLASDGILEVMVSRKKLRPE